MMDTNASSLLVVFSFSALMLWEAWQEHNAPKRRSFPRARSRRLPGSTDAPAPKAPFGRGGNDSRAAQRRSPSPTAGPVAPIGAAGRREDRPLRRRDQHARRRHPSRDDAEAALGARSDEAAHADGARPEALLRHADRGCSARACRTTRRAYETEQTSYALGRRQGQCRGAPQGARVPTASRSRSASRSSATAT